MKNSRQKIGQSTQQRWSLHRLRIHLLAMVVTLFLAPVAHATIIYDISINDTFNQGVSGSGQIDFMGDLSTDGDFGLQASDITSFALTVTAPEGTVIFGLTDLTEFAQYRVAGGELTRLQLIGLVAQGAGGCPDFGGSSVNCSVGFQPFFRAATGNSGFTTGTNSTFGRNWDYTLSRAGAPVPVPAAVWLMGSALLGLVGIGRRKRRHL